MEAMWTRTRFWSPSTIKSPPLAAVRQLGLTHGERGRPCRRSRPLKTDQEPPSYLNESSSLTR
jgi:hypothetical protein